MIRLIKEELRKMFHHKLNILLIVIMILYPWYATYQMYQDGLHLKNMYDADASTTELELLQELDEHIHSFAGPLNQEKMDELLTQGTLELKEIYNTSNFDDEWMKQTYGHDYLDFIERGSQGELTEDEISQIHHENLKYQNEDDHYYFVVRMKNEPYISIIELKYFLDFSYLRDCFYLGNNDFSLLHEVGMRPELLLQENHEYFMSRIDNNDSLDIKEQWKIAAKMEKDVGYVFDSTLPNDFLREGLDSFNFFILLILAFVTSNIFYVEKNRKTEPILFTTKQGKQLYKAKMLTGLLLAFSIAVITLIGIVVQSYFFLPVRDFSLYGVMGTGFFYGETRFLFTYGQLITVEMITIVACYLVVTMMTMGISCISQNAMVSFGVMVLVLVGPQFIPMIQENAILKGIFPNFAIMASYVTDSVLGLVPLNQHLYFNVYLGWIIYLILSVIIFILVNKIGKKHQA